MADGRRQNGRRAAHRGAWIAVLLLGAAASLCLAGGFSGIWQHLTAQSPRPYRLSAAVVLLGTAIVQARMACDAWRRAARGLHNRIVACQLSRADVALAAAAGCVVAYAVSLCLGPDPCVRYLFRALLAMHVTLCGWLVLGGRLPSQPSAALQRWFKVVFRTAAIGLIGVAIAEGSLRAMTRVTTPGAPPAWCAHQQARAMRCQTRDRRQGGPLLQQNIALPISGDRRQLTVLAGEIGLVESGGGNWLEWLARQAPKWEICNYSWPGCHEVQQAALLEYELASVAPEVVLVVVDVASLGKAGLEAPGAFDYRSLRLYQCLAPKPSLKASRRQLVPAAHENDWCEALAACVAPIPPRVQCRYGDALRALTRMSESCRAGGIELRLVIVPAAYQVDAGLCRRLCQRHGLEVGDLDVELPQRRVSAIAAQCGVPALDLLPILRTAAGPLYERESNAWNRAGHEFVGLAVAQWLDPASGPRIAQGQARSEAHVQR